MTTDSYEIATMIKLVLNPAGYNMSACVTKLTALSILSISLLRVSTKVEKLVIYLHRCTQTFANDDMCFPKMEILILLP